MGPCRTAQQSKPALPKAVCDGTARAAKGPERWACTAQGCGPSTKDGQRQAAPALGRPSTRHSSYQERPHAAPQLGCNPQPSNSKREVVGLQCLQQGSLQAGAHLQMPRGRHTHKNISSPPATPPKFPTGQKRSPRHGQEAATRANHRNFPVLLR